MGRLGGAPRLLAIPHPDAHIPPAAPARVGARDGADRYLTNARRFALAVTLGLCWWALLAVVTQTAWASDSSRPAGAPAMPAFTVAQPADEKEAVGVSPAPVFDPGPTANPTDTSTGSTEKPSVGPEDGAGEGAGPVAGTPAPTVVPDPTTVPDPTSVPDRAAGTLDPAAVPDPTTETPSPTTATPAPTVVPDPTTVPDPVAVPDPATAIPDDVTAIPADLLLGSEAPEAVAIAAATPGDDQNRHVGEVLCGRASTTDAAGGDRWRGDASEFTSASSDAVISSVSSASADPAPPTPPLAPVHLPPAPTPAAPAPSPATVVSSSADSAHHGDGSAAGSAILTTDAPALLGGSPVHGTDNTAAPAGDPRDPGAGPPD